MGDAEQSNTGNSYVRAWFGTNSSWSSSPASFWGSSSCAWFGTVPQYNINLATSHYLVPEQYHSYISAVPSGWSNYYYFCTSNMYLAYNNWYLGTSWSGLKASYSYSVIMTQQTTGVFDFSDNQYDRVLYPSDSMWFGD